MFANYRQLSQNTFVLAATIGLVLSAYFMWAPLLGLYLRDLGASEVEVGLAFTILALAHTLPAMLGGLMADRFGRKWVIIGPAFILIPFYVLAGVTRDWLVLTELLTVTNVVGAMQWPAMQALLSESDEERRATAFALIEIFVLGAAVVGPLVGSVLLPLVGVGGLFIVHGLVLVPATYARVRWIHETYRPHLKAKFKVADWRSAIPKAARWVIAANVLFALTLGLSLEGPYVSILANDQWGMGEQQIQWMNAIAALMALFGVWLGGKADQWGGRRIWTVSTFGLAISLTAFGLSSSWQVGALFFFTAHIFYETVFIVSETLLAHYSTPANRSFLFGFTQTVSGIANAMGPTVGAWLISFTRLAATFVAAAAASLLTLAPLSQVADVQGKVAEGIVAEEFVTANIAE